MCPFILKAQYKVPIPSFETTGKNAKLSLVDAPHKGNGIECGSCHILHQSADVQLTNVAGNANLCMSCHNPAGLASNKPFTNADRANPGVSGTSHAWNATAINNTYGASLPTDAEMLKRVYDGKIVCSTCHNQHDQTFPPFLRASNFQNALCKDCHAVRNVGSYRTSPDNKGSHPVGVVYPTSDERFYSSPQNPDLPLIDPDRVECTTCHSPHFAESGGSHSGTGDGYILRDKNDDDLCQACHTYEDHKSQGCRQCHQPHDPAQTNIFLVGPTVETPNSGSKPVIFTAESGPNSFADGDGTYNGICEVCHTKTDFHRNNSSGNHTHNVGVNCTQCHRHKDSFMPSACIECHALPQDNGDGIPAGGRRAIAGEFDGSSHHVDDSEIDSEDCKVCHDQATHMDGYVDLNDVDGAVVSYRAESFAQGVPAEFCLNCHDADGASAFGGLTPFTDGNTVPDVSTYYLSSGHGNGNSYALLKAQGPVTDPMSGEWVYLYSDSANPGADLQCTNCHATHGSANDPILKYANNQSNTLCGQCHPTATSGSGYFLSYHSRSMANYEASKHGNRLCTDCHNPHGTGFTAMTRFDGDNLCLQCHDEKNAFRDILSGFDYDHGNNNCSRCHNPHSTGNDPFLIARLNESPSDFCTDAAGQSLPVVANPETNLALCITCHVQALPPTSHDATRCFACHGWYDEPVLGQACGFADIKTFVNFRIHDDGGSGAPADLGFSGLCLNCHFCGGDCGENPPPFQVAKSKEYTLQGHDSNQNCFSCHDPHKLENP
ncbi:MAG: cytochrome c3 family protein [bacterium]